MTTENVTSETILREIRARVLTRIKYPPHYDSDIPVWDAEMKMLLHAELIYSRPEIIPISPPEGQRFQVTP